VTDTQVTDRPVWRSLLRPLVAIVFFTIGASVGYYTGYWVVPPSAQNIIKELRADRDKLTTQRFALQKENFDLKEQRDKLNKKLEAIVPSANEYNIKPNESQIFPLGHFTVGLVGTPGNQVIGLNINGETHQAQAGDIFDVAMTCRVQVVSFSVIDANATVNASCTETKR
jgi:hypothetical protein